jgi:hypothetical protein
MDNKHPKRNSDWSNIRYNKVRFAQNNETWNLMDEIDLFFSLQNPSGSFVFDPMILFGITGDSDPDMPHLKGNIQKG